MAHNEVETTSWARKTIPSISSILVVGLVACNAGDPPDKLAGASDKPPNPAGGIPSNSTDARDLFDAMEPKLMAACGTCHDAGGLANRPFLAGPDRYQSFASWPGIVARDPVQSILLIYPRVGTGHTGNSLDSPELVNTLLPDIEKWLDAEAQALMNSPDERPHTEPFTPFMGPNVVYLESIGSDFKGMAIAFVAQMVVPTTLELTKIEVYPTVDLGVHIEHPLFVQYPVDKVPVPDPIDNFSNVDQIFEADTPGLLGPGALVLADWSAEAKLSIAFSNIETHISSGPPPETGGCKDLASFEANAKNQFVVCAGCHDGTNSQANAAMDLSTLMTDSAKACAQIRNRINPADPPNSQIFINTDPNAGAPHPYKLKGKSFPNFRDAVTIWVVAEK